MNWVWAQKGNCSCHRRYHQQELALASGMPATSPGIALFVLCGGWEAPFWHHGTGSAVGVAAIRKIWQKKQSERAYLVGYACQHTTPSRKRRTHLPQCDAQLPPISELLATSQVRCCYPRSLSSAFAQQQNISVLVKRRPFPFRSALTLHFRGLTVSYWKREEIT